MAFEKQSINFNNFQRSNNLTDRIIENDKKEQEVVVPVKKTRREKKEYMTLNFYPSEKAKLRRLAEKEDKSVSQVIEDWLATIED